jgi:adenylate cyclase, class 2
VSVAGHLEIEVKIRWDAGAAEARSRIEGAGFPQVAARTLESDTVFDLAAGELRASNRLLRLRRSGESAIVTYKGPPHGGPYKTREEIEFDLSDARAFEDVLDRLGYHPTFRYEKFRTKFAALDEPGIVSIDETPIGVFLELEGEPAWIDKTAARLGLSPREYLVSSYASLYREYLGLHPGAPSDMTFGAGSRVEP